MTARRRWTAAERRRAIRLRQIEHMSHADIGAALGRSERSVREQLGEVGVSRVANVQRPYAIAYPSEMYAEAVAALRDEIAAAKREARTTLPYKGGW